MTDQAKRNIAIDGLRGFCALYVILFHIGFPKLGPHVENPLLHNIMYSGILSVHVFFCLSGFLVFTSILGVLDKPHPIQLFYFKRFLRIMPLWWLLLSYRFFILKSMPLNVFLGNLVLFLGNLTNNSPYLPIVVSWSLLAEKIFYLLLPLILGFLSFRGSIIFTIFFAGLNYLVFLPFFPWLLQSFEPDSIYRFPFFQFYFFFIGILFYRLLENPRAKACLEFAFSHRTFFLLDLITVAIYWNLLEPIGLKIPEMVRVPALVLNVLSGQSLLSRFFSNRVFQKLGIWCYGIYLLHLEFYSWDRYFYPYLHDQILLRILEEWLIRLSIIVPVSALSYHCFEIPIRKIGLNYFFGTSSLWPQNRNLSSTTSNERFGTH